MNKVNVRVEVKYHNPHGSHDERFRDFKKAFTVFKKLMNTEGVMAEYKAHEYYESRGRKKRRKQREAELAQLKGKLKENFFDTK